MNNWNRQSGETTKAYMAFCEYIKMPTNNRSLENVAKKLGKSVTLLGRWSSKYDWVNRATGYDDHLRKKERIEFEEQRKRAKQDRIKILSGFKGIVAQSMKNLDINDPKYNDVISALRLLVEQERIEFDDLPMSKNQNINIDLSELTIEQLERLAKGEDVYDILTNSSGGRN